MNFPLQKIESHLDEQSLLQGELIYEAEGVVALTEVERNLWVATVEEGDRTYEVEIKISPSKVNAATCECARFREEGQCSHLAAALLSLRREVDRRKKKKQPAPQKRRTRKLTTGVVLENVDRDDLVAFVQQYAKTNRSFALALKARFALNVSVIESKDKYLQLLDSTLSMARKPDRTISLRGSRKIRKVLIEMHAQIEEATTKQYYSEAITMAQSIIEKMTPVLRKLENLKSELQEQITLAFDALRKVVDRKPAPDLLRQLWEYLFEECRKLTYRNNQIDQLFFRLLLHMADDNDRRSQLETLLEEHILRYRRENRNASPLLITLIKLLEQNQEPERAQQLIEQNLSNPELLRFGLRRARQREDHERVKKLALLGLDLDYPPSVRAEIEEHLFYLAQLEGDNSTIAKYATRRFLQSFDFQYYDALKSSIGEDWNEKWPELIGAIQRRPFALDNRRAIAEIYRREGRWEQLVAYLNHSRSLDLLQAFAEHLRNHDPDTLRDLSLALLRGYLQEHLGRKTSQRIRGFLLHLQEQGADEIAGRLVEQLREEYPERHSLMEELGTVGV